MLVSCVLAAPKAKVPPRFQDVATFEKGEDIVIKIPFTGSPKPKAKWLRDGEEIKSGDRYRVETGDRHAILTIKGGMKTDDGPYKLQLDNDLGSDTVIIKIQVNGTFADFAHFIEACSTISNVILYKFIEELIHCV
jgi:hypothetical protein